MNGDGGALAIVLTGGGARAAYQVGVLRGVARRLPATRLDIITGVSAGAINAIFLASRQAPLADIVEELSRVWGALQLQDILHIESASLLRKAAAWVTKLGSGGSVGPRVRGLVDTKPLRKLLERLYPENSDGEIAGLAESVARCDPKAVAVTTLDYNTGRTVTWVAGCNIETWDRPLRRGVLSKLTSCRSCFRRSNSASTGTATAASVSPPRSLPLCTSAPLACSRCRRTTESPCPKPTSRRSSVIRRRRRSSAN
ncbi:MAG: hypothetical protein DMF58_03835 [Acidobacteria bacterium]|nr:MAG: hypothetical protein DMF58_03835 [Acidobacteriota bacterium]